MRTLFYGFTLLALLSCKNPDQPGLLVPKTVDHDASLVRWTMSDGVSIHYRTAGNPTDTALIILHGGPGGDFEGYLELEPLSAHYFVVWFDQRGAGQSSRIDHTKLQPETYLSDLNTIAGIVSPGRPFILLGHSWGGAYAAWYASEFGNRIAKLVLIEPGALHPEAAKVANTSEFRFSAAGIHHFLAMQGYTIPATHERADYFFANLMNADIGDDRDFFDPAERSLLKYRRFGFHANLAMNTWQGNFDQSYTFDLRGKFTGFSQPVLFLGGSHSQRLGYGFQQKHHVPLFTNGRIEKIEQAGHFMIETQPQAVLAAIRRFLGRNG
jgi:proline iminopeptidase